MTFHSDIAHPEEVAGVCHHLNSDAWVKNKSSMKDKNHAKLCFYSSLWMLLLASKRYTRRTEILHANIVSGQSSRLVGNDYCGFGP